ncbi:MAG: NERD domain-containing protein [Defluviitaleaceae bacterium]|nr:NERD domain-containing protein [Defluviitaleaceae bacterium]MCL2239198.1 NERD domain-containing protein [Defluviitaleaceae bacterium]MCL2240307.1 NERD domain-containing protein [Defluviitaleaceae bacterium]
MGFFYHIETFIDYLLNPNEYKDRGSMGEQFTYRELRGWFSKRQILRNLYIPKNNGELTEIDLAVVCRKCIIVVESKNLSGWIYGHEKDINWTQTLPGYKFSFYNPIMQNQTHVDSLKPLLTQFPTLPILSLIVFSDRCTLKNISVTSDNVVVIQRKSFKSYIKKVINKSPNVISKDERNMIISHLSKYSRPDASVRELHLQQLAAKNAVCPKCRGVLIEKLNRNTNVHFLGCENFPSCKFTTNKYNVICERCK